MRLHDRVLQVADVNADVLGVSGELDRVLRTHRERASLNERRGLDTAGFVDRYFHELLTLVHRQSPPFGQAARDPEAIVVQVAEAVADDRPVGVKVDVVTAFAIEGRDQ